jgi:hypothetical protein
MCCLFLFNVKTHELLDARVFDSVVDAVAEADRMEDACVARTHDLAQKLIFLGL